MKWINGFRGDLAVAVVACRSSEERMLLATGGRVQDSLLAADHR